MCFWQVVGQHPILTFFVTYIVGQTICNVAESWSKRRDQKEFYTLVKKIQDKNV